MKRIRKEKQKDFISDQSPTQVETNGPETKYGIVSNCLYLKMRKEPNIESESMDKTLGLLRRGDVVEVIGRVDNFYKIRVKGKIVYVVAACIKEE